MKQSGGAGPTTPGPQALGWDGAMRMLIHQYQAVHMAEVTHRPRPVWGDRCS